MLFKKELCITRDLKMYNAIASKLTENGIKYTSISNLPANTGRYHGVPFVKSEFAYEYKIFVSRKDYEYAKHLIG